MTYKIPRQTVRLVRDGSPTEAPRVITADVARRVFRSLMPEDLPHEEVHVLCLDAKNRAIATFMVARGGGDGAGVYPADILRPVLVSGARAFLMAHNHPSGDPAPSLADIDMTAKVRESAKVLGVPLLDHIVLGEGDSFATC